jgi:translation elongation factor EF-Ts
MGENIIVRRFVRYQVGEAIEGENSTSDSAAA